MLDEAEFGKGMALLIEAFHAEVSELGMHAYWITVQDFSSSDWSLAVRRALRESRFMPRASELRDYAQEISSDDRALAAWDEVRRAISQHGVYQSIDFEDRIINAAIRGMGGWRRVCMLPAEDFAVWGRKEFERQYVTFARRGLSFESEQAAPLDGIIAQQNVALGLDGPPPRRVAATTPTIGQASAQRKTITAPVERIDSGEKR